MLIAQKKEHTHYVCFYHEWRPGLNEGPIWQTKSCIHLVMCSQGQNSLSIGVMLIVFALKISC